MLSISIYKAYLSFIPGVTFAVMIAALVAIGLNTSFKDMRIAKVAPMLNLHFGCAYCDYCYFTSRGTEIV